ncbi:MAG TPA: hypothetical protein EYG21_03130 [Nitrospinaceae bacterium]|jgi:hypothetical protein|nr:hypothetical protein [Nitrospinaceae bacterium]
MAKLSRNQLKSLIKECLVEVLVEGLVSSSGNVKLEGASRSKKTSKSVPQRRTALDNITYNDNSKILQESVAACTSDPVLGDILADTARTTLQEQFGDSSNPGHDQQVSVNGDPAAKMVAGADPLDMFGDSANNWAALAFNAVSDK